MEYIYIWNIYIYGIYIEYTYIYMEYTYIYIWNIYIYGIYIYIYGIYIYMEYIYIYIFHIYIWNMYGICMEYVWNINPYWLVVLTCFNHLEKYEFANGNDYPIYDGKHVSNHQPAYMNPTLQMG